MGLPATTPSAPTRAQRAHAVGLLDAALADAALARNPEAREVAVVDLHVGFVQAPGDGALSAQGQATGGGRSVCFCEAELRNAEGALVARAMGTLRYLA